MGMRKRRLLHQAEPKIRMLLRIAVHGRKGLKDPYCSEHLQ